MLKEQTSVDLNSGESHILTVDDILEAYAIKGLSLENLQEKYVDMVDDYTEKINDLKKDKEELTHTVNDLTEEIRELSNTIENKETNVVADKPSGELIIIVFIVAVIISFLLGKKYNKK